MKLDFDTLMNWLRKKYPYDMYVWVQKNYWLTDEPNPLKENE